MTLPDGVAELLGASVVARVSTVNPDGSPQVAPFWISFDGKLLHLDTLDNRTTRNLRRDARVAVLVDEGTTFAELRGTLVHGSARLWTEADAPQHVRAGIKAIRAVHADEIATPLFAAYAANETRSPILVEIVPQRASHWDLAASAPP